MEQNINVINFTVIIPHKNIPLLLQRCLDSIPRRDDLQIIVVDDASDETVVDFNRFPGLGDQHVEVIFSKAAKGGGHARNLGLTKALGKWVIFADADDFFTAEFPQIIYSYKDDESDLIYFNVDSVQSDDITKKADRSATKQTLFDNYRKDTKEGDISFRLKYPEPWGKMIKGELIKSNQIKFDEVPVSNDYFFSIQIGCLAKQIKVVNKALYVITLRSGSISHNFGDTLDKLLIRLDVAIRVQSYLAKFGYELTPMPIRGLMVLLLKMNLSIFTKQLFKIHKAGLSVRKLLTQMFDPKFFKK